MQQPSPPDSNFAPSIQLHYEGEGVQLRADAPHPQQIEWFPRYKNEWNNTQKILQVILAANVDPKSACISQSLNLPRPCHGAHLIYPRLDGAWFKADGYIWRKRKNNRNTREDHMRLKVNGQELINCKYVHSAIVPTFHRRIYFLPDSTHVLVHYLNETPSITDDTAEEIARTIKANNVLISLEQLSEQLDPIYVFNNDRESLGQFVKAINKHLINKGIILPESQVSHDTATTTTPATREMHLERRNSCSSAFRKSLSSTALRRQPSANSEIDANHIGTMLKRFGCNGSSNDKLTIVPSILSNYSPNRNHSAMESRSPSGDAGNNFEEDSIYQQLSVKSSTNGSTPASAFAEKMKIRSGSQEFPMGPPATPSSSTASASISPILEMSPNTSSMKGGQKLLVVGGYYRKGHDYKISFGRGRMMAATLIHAGVLSCTIPPSGKPEVVQVRVFCNGLPVSTAADFSYEPAAEHEQKEDDDKLVQIFEKIRLVACAFNAFSAVENIQSSSCMESLLTNLVQQIDTQVTSHGSSLEFRAELLNLLNGSSQFPSKTVLHLVASFDYDRLFEALIDLSRKVPLCRELDIFARDNDGSTPLHFAFKHNASRTARIIMNIDASAIDVMNDKGKTPSEVAPEDAMDILSEKNNEEERVNATELWVMTNGKTFTSENLLSEKISRTPIAEKDDLMREATSSYSVMSGMYEGPSRPSRDCDEDCDSCYEHTGQGQLHVEIAMDTDVHVPDSPKMARLFHAVTSPGMVVTPNARARMAELARQIIDALPDRIKRNSEASTFPDEEMSTQMRGMDSMFYQTSCSMSVDSPFVDDYIDMMTASRSDTFTEPRSTAENTDTNTTRSAQLFATNCNFFEDRSFASSSTRANTFESDTLEFDKDLGEFFTIHVDNCVDPIQQRLANLKFNDDEQRDVYEAAMVIQRAYREYRARSTTRRQEDIERRAALKIQGCYRRYKQFCYFKKLHNAAIVVQKHFRMRKRDDKEEGSVEAVIASVPEHPTLDGQSICIQVPKTNSTLLRERAATTIQVAYRYRHRKRQAAARKIQNFMRQNRNKLRKMHAQNEDGTSPARKPLESNETNEMPMANGKEMLSSMNSFRVPPQHHIIDQQSQSLQQQHGIINGTN